ncbi:MAG: hypothetical protein WDW36_009260 [Sanguina aurantia]
MAGLSVAAAAYMGRQALLAFVKFQASPPILRAFYKGGFQPEMNKREACLILGLRDSAADDKIKDAHRRIMIANHPDAGPPTGPGQVYLIGTGPGDPGLLTLRAAQLMQSADVVLYDRLVSDDILRLVSPSARMVYVGKAAGFHTRTQDEIHELLLAFASAGAVVVRLKGGDPYVFGRGGEEMQYLRAHGVAVHCVPGITAASGICAELGIPMTHRGVATSVRFLTGHSKEGGEEALDAGLALAADPSTTLVVYMGLQTLPNLTARLMEAGMDPKLPAVAVERGTTPSRRIVYSEVGALSGKTIEAKLKSPTLLVMGAVVALCPGWQAWIAAGRPLEFPAVASYPELEFNPEMFSARAARTGVDVSRVVSDAPRVTPLVY